MNDRGKEWYLSLEFILFPEESHDHGHLRATPKVGELGSHRDEPTTATTRNGLGDL